VVEEKKRGIDDKNHTGENLIIGGGGDWSSVRLKPTVLSTDSAAIERKVNLCLLLSTLPWTRFGERIYLFICGLLTAPAVAQSA